MRSTTTVVLTALASLAGMTQASGWAQFCDDDDCSINCGETVSLDDPGCLGESGRGSIKISSSSADQVFSLIASSADGCNCQETCSAKLWFNNNCYRLSSMGMDGAPSFRFISGDCPADNC